MITDEPLGDPDGAQGRRLWPIARPPWTRLDTIAATALAVAIAALLAPHLARCMSGDPSAACSDYAAHVHVATRMLNGGVVESYFLYHLVIALLAELPGLAPQRAALLGTLGFHVGLGLVVYALTRTALRARPAPVAAPAAALTALAIGLVAHGVALDWDPAELYLGFVGINSFHNPTINALKPFALLLLPYAAAIFTPVAARRPLLLGGAAAAAIASTLAKPSYAICLLPALASLTLWQWGRGRPIDWRLGAAVVLPTVLTLAVQYQATYVGQADTVVLAPLAVLRLWGASDLLDKFVLSVLFPLAVAGLFPFRVLASAPLVVAWTTFAWGAGFTYLLAESGPRMGHGNFGWSGEIALFVLFVASTLLVLRIATTADGGAAVRLRLAACALAFAVHLVSGILWYGVHLHVIPGEPFPYVPDGVVGQFEMIGLRALKGRHSIAEGNAAGGALGIVCCALARPEGAPPDVRSGGAPSGRESSGLRGSQGTACGVALGYGMAPLQGADEQLCTHGPTTPDGARLTRPADAGCFAAAANGQGGRTQAT